MSSVPTTDPIIDKAISMARRGFSATAIKTVVGGWMGDSEIRALVADERSEAVVSARIQRLRDEEKRAEEHLAAVRSRIRMAEGRLRTLTDKLDAVHSANADHGMGPDMEEIVARVAKKTGIRRQEILWGGRVAALSAARQEIMYLAAAETPMSTPEIGRRLGGLDHTTVIHGIRRHAERNGLPLPRGMRPLKPAVTVCQ